MVKRSLLTLTIILVLSVFMACVSQEDETISVSDPLAYNHTQIIDAPPVESTDELLECVDNNKKVIESGSNFRIADIGEPFSLRYEILNNSGEVVKNFDTFRPARIGLISENVVELWVSAGTNAGWSVFFSIKDDILSDYFSFPYVVKDELIAYIEWTNYDSAKLIVQDIFDPEVYYREFLLEDLAPEARPTSSTYIEYLGDNRIKIKNLLYEDYVGKSIIIEL